MATMCKVCRDDYTDGREPLSLRCGHSFCRECLGNLEKRGALLCPTCNTPQPCHVRDLPVNHDLLAEACPDALPPAPAPHLSDGRRLRVLVVPGEADPPLTLNLLPATKVKDVKLLLRVNHGLDCRQVVFQGRQLDDLSSLHDQGVVSGGTLHLDPGGSERSELGPRPSTPNTPSRPPVRSKPSRPHLPPLLASASNGDLNQLRKWLDNGSDVNMKTSSDGQTALHLASEAGHAGLVLELFRYGASVNARDAADRRPLHLAAATGQSKIIPALLRKGAMIEAQDKQGARAVHMAARGGHLKALKVLEEHGCLLTAACGGGDQSTALHLAAENGRLDVVGWLVEQGLSTTAKDINRMTPEQRAMSPRHLDVTDYLHSLSVSADPEPRRSISAHDAAAEKFRKPPNANGDYVHARGRRDAGGHDVQGREKGRVDAAGRAGGRGAPAGDSVKGREHIPSADDEKLLEAAADGDLQAVVEAVRDGAYLEVVSTRPGEEGLRPLHLAAWCGYGDVAGHLLEFGAEGEVAAIGRRAVHWAAVGGHVGVLKVLRERGCQLNALTVSGGWTALHLAADEGNLEVVRWLVEEGRLDPAATTVAGLTPGHMARAAHNTDIVNYLRTLVYSI